MFLIEKNLIENSCI